MDRRRRYKRVGYETFSRFVIKTYLRCMISSSVRLENFSEAEKRELIAILKKRRSSRVALFVLLILVFLSCLVYFNGFSQPPSVQDKLEILNVVFVVIFVIGGRLVVSEVVEYKKESAAEQKKVLNTKILAVSGNKITLGNKSFSKEDVLLGCPDFDQLKPGDLVRLEISSKSDALFSIKKMPG